MASDVFPPDLTAVYDMGERLAAGGFGAVYRARHRGLDREAAVKLLHAEAQADREQVERFAAEARAAAQLEHPHIVRVLDFGLGQDGRSPWIAYAFATGESVARRLSRGPLDPRRACLVAAQVARALAAAHARGIVHRDVKPDNVLEIQPGHFALCDFGIALWSAETRVKTATGVILGTPSYLAPELIEGHTATPASDVYALGVMLHEMLAGAPPFEGALVQVMRAHLVTPPPDVRVKAPQTDAEVAVLVQRALAKNPADRFASADHLAEALEELVEQVPEARPPATARLTRPAKSAGSPEASGLGPRASVAALAATAAVLVAWVAVQPGSKAPERPATPVPSLGAIARPSPLRASVLRSRYTPHPQVRKFVEQAETFHNLGGHRDEAEAYANGMKNAAESALDASGPPREEWLEQWIGLRDLALSCDGAGDDHATAARFVRATARYDEVERLAFRESLARTDLADALDRAQLKIDAGASDEHAPTAWIGVRERGGPSPLLTRDRLHLLVTDRMDAIATANKDELFHGLRQMPDAGWNDPAQRGALEELAWIAVCQLNNTNGLREKDVPPKLKPRQHRRLISHAVVAARLLLERVVGRGYPVHAQLKLVRMARHLAVLARQFTPDREAALVAALDEALHRKTCGWLKIWRDARARHDRGEHAGECRGYAQALLAFEGDVGFTRKSLDDIPQAAFLAWLRLRGDLSPIRGTQRAHEDGAVLAATELALSWVPEPELAARLPEIMRRADWDEAEK